MGFLTFDAVFLLNLGSTVQGFLVAVVPDGDVGTCLGEALGNCEADTGSSPGDDGGSAFEGEERHHFGLVRGSGVVVGKVPSFHRRVCHDCRVRGTEMKQPGM
jgi:hypothetical protein